MTKLGLDNALMPLFGTITHQDETHILPPSAFLSLKKLNRKGSLFTDRWFPGNILISSTSCLIMQYLTLCLTCLTL